MSTWQVYKYVERVVINTHLPKPDDLFWGAIIVTVNGMLLPVIDIYFLHATQQQLQLPLIKVLEPLQRYHFWKALKEVSSLGFLSPG